MSITVIKGAFRGQNLYKECLQIMRDCKHLLVNRLLTDNTVDPEPYFTLLKSNQGGERVWYHRPFKTEQYSAQFLLLFQLLLCISRVNVPLYKFLPKCPMLYPSFIVLPEYLNNCGAMLRF